MPERDADYWKGPGVVLCARRAYLTQPGFVVSPDQDEGHTDATPNLPEPAPNGPMFMGGNGPTE